MPPARASYLCHAARPRAKSGIGAWSSHPDQLAGPAWERPTVVHRGSAQRRPRGHTSPCGAAHSTWAPSKALRLPPPRSRRCSQQPPPPTRSPVALLARAPPCRLVVGTFHQTSTPVVSVGTPRSTSFACRWTGLAHLSPGDGCGRQALGGETLRGRVLLIGPATRPPTARPDLGKLTAFLSPRCRLLALQLVRRL